MKISYKYIMVALFGISCQGSKESKTAQVRLVTLDPGHFHAALVQKSMYPEIDSKVYVYAPEGADVQQHLDRVEGYNKALVNPTTWQEQVYKGQDFLEKMMSEKKGNVVVIAGNNKSKTNYIKRSIENGFNVLADKPMVIDKSNFEVLKNTFAKASEKKLLLYDIMTERYEITNALQKELASIPGIFGKLENGSLDNPAVVMESVHFFYKNVSGKVLTRPTWFMDMDQQGEAIVDVATHLVDLVHWQCFPDQVIDYTKNVKINSARRWSTDMTPTMFQAITKVENFPADLMKNVINDSVLQVYANGEINYSVNGVYVRLIAKWDYKASSGGDSHYSYLKGTNSNLVIRQGAEQNNAPTLYIETTNTGDAYNNELRESFKSIQIKYPGVDLKKIATGWEVIIPQKYKDGHEAHFAQVTAKFLEYLDKRNMPAWEIPNMMAKYFITTEALELAKSSQAIK